MSNTFSHERLFYINTIIPNPELTSRPPHKAPKERLLETNSSVNSNELEQLGIKPTIQAYKGVRYLFVSKKALKLSSPTPVMIKPIARLIIKT